MKVITLLAFLLAPALGFAMPSVGDTAVTEGTITTEGHTLSLISEDTLTSYNTHNDEYLHVSEYSENFRTEVSQEWRATDELMGTENVQTILDYCEQIDGGQKVTVDVPAGSFDTCKLPLDEEGQSGYVWIGQVAFGVVKLDLTETNNGFTYNIKLNLVSFEFGK